jgi:hypothetical protein
LTYGVTVFFAILSGAWFAPVRGGRND